MFHKAMHNVQKCRHFLYLVNHKSMIFEICQHFITKAIGIGQILKPFLAI